MEPEALGAEGWSPEHWVPREELCVGDAQRNGRGHHACAADGVFCVKRLVVRIDEQSKQQNSDRNTSGPRHGLRRSACQRAS